jgi:hypothetical protein
MESGIIEKYWSIWKTSRTWEFIQEHRKNNMNMGILSGTREE